MLGLQEYMRIKVKLDVSLPLKRKKKSFCPIRVRIDSSKVIFEWDISLCAVTKRRTAPVSRWLGEVGGPVCRNLDKESGDNGHNDRNDSDILWLWKDDLERLYLNLNYIPLGPRIEALNYEHVNQQNMGCGVDNRASNHLVGDSSLRSRLALLCGAVKSNENSKLEHP
ncbi:hypothetical protein Goari_001250 [Gossypium aridum]|uniref:Uncharacterized protein n=1 Tax=Gossypium aridum TaxID=34290 RepID=A0A7J8YJ68_GOSAI|nr:hypothetical protein [Gossypium aridum]